MLSFKIFDKMKTDPLTSGRKKNRKKYSKLRLRKIINKTWSLKLTKKKKMQIFPSKAKTKDLLSV